MYNFLQICYPLIRLTQKNRHFEWTKESENAFNTLKRLLTESLVLSYSDTKETFIHDTHASSYGVGAVLSQIQNVRETVIVYGSSKTFTKLNANIAQHITNFLLLFCLLRTLNITFSST